MVDVAVEVISIIASKIRGRKPEIRLTDKLEDLGIASLDTVAAIFDLEEKFDLQIPFSPRDVLANFATVADVIRAVQALVDAKV